MKGAAKNQSAFHPKGTLSALPQRFLLSVIVGLTLSTPSLAQDSNPFIEPFIAHYSASFDVGLSISGKGSRQLQQLDNGQWLFTQKADAMMASIVETSEFRRQQQQLVPSRYEYTHKVLGNTRHALLSFDWDKQQVINDVQDKPWALDITPQTLDKLNVQLQLRMDIRAGKQQMSYAIADGGRIKTYRFRVIGEELLDTELGTLETVKVQRYYDDGKAMGDKQRQRKTLIWFAKPLDYLLVKLSQIDKKDQRSELLIKRLEQL